MHVICLHNKGTTSLTERHIATRLLTVTVGSIQLLYKYKKS